mmetsp:Transcript_27825/g.56357  ORF Transcript_27825/g.56357 Transcript_27825/m.56357 type:complete len:125 (+) Transcript_27825:27-401(+)
MARRTGSEPNAVQAKQLAAAVPIVLIGLLFSVCIISFSDLKAQPVVLEGLSSGGEYEDEHRVSAAIAMAEATDQTDLLDYKEQFAEQLEAIEGEGYIQEATTATKEQEALSNAVSKFQEGSDPW